MGIAISTIIALVISFIIGDGKFSFTAPTLAERAGSEVKAALIQIIFSGLLGGCYGAISLIWDINSWSVLKKTAIYFILSAVIMLPIAYINNWMQHSLAGLLGFVGIFIVIFIIIWIFTYIGIKKDIAKLNDHINKERK